MLDGLNISKNTRKKPWKRRREKKGQIEMIESIMVLLVIIVIIFIGLVFYFKASAKGIEKSGEETCFQSNEVLLSTVMQMPEIACSINKRIKDTCIDSLKALALSSVALENIKLGVRGNCKVNILAYLVYPIKQNGDVICDEENYPACNVFRIYDGFRGEGIEISSPVALYYPLDGEYKIGKVVIEVEALT